MERSAHAMIYNIEGICQDIIDETHGNICVTECPAGTDLITTSYEKCIFFIIIYYFFKFRFF